MSKYRVILFLFLICSFSVEINVDTIHQINSKKSCFILPLLSLIDRDWFCGSSLCNEFKNEYLYEEMLELYPVS